MKKPEPYRYRAEKTCFGPLVIVWDHERARPMIRQILISKPGQTAQSELKKEFPGAVRSSCAAVDHLAVRIAAFLEGTDVRFALEHVRLDLCTAFQKKVLLAEYGIPRGSVSTYRRIADYLGVSGGARAVGNALATNPFPIVIPCHRAIRSDGSLGGYQGGLDMKRVLLEQEGIEFDENGRVLTKDLYY